jgi:class 3 adenylate cyclase/pSer/pThr/pTyr-binding forkhead associated (FHA) protein
MSPENGKDLHLPLHASDTTQTLEKLRRNVTVLFTDIKGSTAYFERYGDAAGLMMVSRCNALLSQAVERHQGRVIKTIGDAIMAAFEDHFEAISASIEMQQALTADNAAKPEIQRVAVRIGINYGLGIVKSNDVYGDVVNVASRVEGAAAPEQIVISDSLYKAVCGSNRFRLRHMGKFPLKGKAAHQDLFEVEWKDQAESRPAMSHNLIASAPQSEPPGKFKLVQIRTGGVAGKYFELKPGETYLGKDQGDFTFPNDEYLRSPHLKLTLDRGQLFLEPIEDAVAFFSLVGPYRLQHGDVVKIGSQYLEFRADIAALESASLNGTGLSELTSIMHAPVAEFVSLGNDPKVYPLTEQLITWGRTKANYVFPTDTTMSRSHAKVYHRGQDFFIEDTGSTNGTFVMAKEKTPIPENVLISVGGQLLRAAHE